MQSKIPSLFIKATLIICLAFLSSCLKYSQNLNDDLVNDNLKVDTGATSSSSIFSSKAKPIIALGKIDVVFNNNLIKLESLSEFSITGSSYKSTSSYSGDFLRKVKRFSHFSNSKDAHFFVEWKNNKGKLNRFSIKSKNGVVSL